MSIFLIVSMKNLLRHKTYQTYSDQWWRGSFRIGRRRYCSECKVATKSSPKSDGAKREQIKKKINQLKHTAWYTAKTLVDISGQTTNEKKQAIITNSEHTTIICERNISDKTRNHILTSGKDSEQYSTTQRTKKAIESCILNKAVKFSRKSPRMKSASTRSVRIKIS